MSRENIGFEGRAAVPSVWNPDRESVFGAVGELSDQDVRNAGCLHAPLVRLMRVLGLSPLSELTPRHDDGFPGRLLDPAYSQEVNDRLEKMKWDIAAEWERIAADKAAESDRVRLGGMVVDMYHLAQDAERMAIFGSAVGEAEAIAMRAESVGPQSYFKVARAMIAVLRVLGERDIPKLDDLPESGFEMRWSLVREQLGKILEARSQGGDGSLKQVAEAAKSILRIADEVGEGDADSKKDEYSSVA
ncbi:MAG: hypothetical protein HGA38_03715 [Candidatus Moranbacteria bacterium]|nr:hypothetical protein [Candidatus Moranbacteria bacterium]